MRMIWWKCMICWKMYGLWSGRCKLQPVYYNHFTVLWNLSRTTSVSRYQKVHFAVFWIFWCKMKITQQMHQQSGWTALPSIQTGAPTSAIPPFLRATAYYICYSTYMPWQFRLSVCLSITRVDQSKMVEARITQFSPYSSPIHLVFRG